jgi:hypothetical protein
MESLKQKILSNFKEAFKSKNELSKRVLGSLKSEIKNQEIDQKGDELSDEEVLKIIKRAIKQRKEAAQQYREGGREELAAAEEQEVAVLEEYLPEQLEDEVIEMEVKKVIEETGANSPDDLGKVMGKVMGKLQGQADGTKVREITQSLLSQD